MTCFWGGEGESENEFSTCAVFSNSFNLKYFEIACPKPIMDK